ncbi:MAG TPA: serine/threonine-protein kinase [Thermomonas sp.]|nr:serine/threonine-protein kinase [Thermomonas sp.]
MNDDTGLARNRWWLNPALAQLAFGASTHRAHAADMTGTAMMEHALLHAGMAGLDLDGLDLDDPAQREFGDYELLELIGQGGMGMVYRARQRGLDREVAIKVLSAGQSAPQQFVDGLRREAQHAAKLQHPNIIVIHEMGEFTGLIYYAMQLVRGRSLSQRLDTDGPLPPLEAARLLRTVAEAVDYAHRLGVLHLDLKPGNILLDECGTPLIADFGLARRLEQALDNERISGTPSYMAPEQAQLHGPALTPATDVWGLGAILYELLTGTPPFESGDAHATLRLLLDGKVRKPSRSTLVPPDLEAICLHCLSRDPQRRYPTARALADDLGRFLEDRSVSVRPLNAPRRIARWMHREPKLAAASIAASLALLVGLVVSVWMWQRAERSNVLASEVNRFLNEDVLAAADPYLELGQQPDQLTVLTLLAGAEGKLDRGLVHQPAARAQVGLTLARAYFGLGLWSKARLRLEKAHADARMVLGHDARLTLDIEEQLGVTATFDGHYAQAEAIYRHLLDARRRTLGWDAPATLTARRGHALLLSETDRFLPALAEYESIHKAASVNAPRQLAELEWTMADLYIETNRWDEAEALMRSALPRTRRQLGELHPKYLWETWSLGDLLMMRAHWDEADAIFRNMRDGLTRTVGDQHPKVLTAVHSIGQVRLMRGQPESALPLLQQAMNGRIRLHGEDHKWSHYSMNRVGEALLALGRPRESIALLERTLDLATRAGRRKQAYVLLIMDNLARAYMAVGELDRAQHCLDEALVNARDGLPANNIRRALLERSRGELYALQGQPEPARVHYQTALAIVAEGFGEAHPDVIDLRRRLHELPNASSGESVAGTIR